MPRTSAIPSPALRRSGTATARAVAVLVIALALTATATASPALGQAVRADNRPTPLAGQENGRLDDRSLISVAPGCRVSRQAGPSLRLLLDTAASRGVAVGTRSCYRPIDDQVRVREQWTDRGNSACAAPVQRDPAGRPVGTSMHGWAKAVDFSDRGGPMTFTSPGYRFLVQHAGRFGWNHPGWARPGGGPCPEPWHWEWVGDGGRLGAAAVPADVVAIVPSATGQGYAVVSGLGALRSHGDAPTHGAVPPGDLGWVVVGAAGTPTGGIYVVSADGAVFGFGGAVVGGSLAGRRLNQPVIDLAVQPSAGDGYWLLAADGGVFSFGGARFWGSAGDRRLNRPVVSMAATPTGDGYWLVAADGGVFSFGDARFWGSTGHLRLAEPVVAMATTPSGAGYWLAAADGGVFTFGDARFWGSAGATSLTAPVVDMAATPSGGGYWLVTADGTVLGFGDAAVQPPR